MKKLLFVLAFTFIGIQVFSQIYLVTINDADFGSCGVSERTITTIDPTGTETNICVDSFCDNNNTLGQLNQVLNSITSQGYKLINFTSSNGSITHTTSGNTILSINTTFIFAIP